MLRTVLLLDGSEAMNSNSDYLPSYLLAMRPPLLRLVERYLDSTPLASLGIVVMRDGISHRLLPCTTNRNEVVDVLERDIFLHGGSGSMSLENGLRMAMSELVDMRKVAALAAANANSAKAGTTKLSAGANTREAWKGSATQLNVLLISASVTLIDPTDVFNVVNTLAALSVRINVVSLVGAVHVFDVCAVETGGTLFCPLNYDHLLQIVDDVATAHRAQSAAAAAKKKMQRSRRREKRPRTSASDVGDGATGQEEDDEDAPSLIPIGCPVYLTAPPSSTPPPPPQQQQQQQGISTATSTSSDLRGGAPSYYLACPQCHLIQLSVPTTCPMCRLLLCSAPMLYSTYVSHNSLVPPATRLRVVRSSDEAAEKEKVKKSEETIATDAATATEGTLAVTEAQPARCALCMTRIPVDAAPHSAVATATSSSTSAKASVWQCSACASLRCDACQDFVMHTIGLCPHCVSLR